jgi:flagellar hook assembly protein FlgD
VKLDVLDVSGRHVRTLVYGDVEAGRRVAVWEGRDDHGLRVASGVYFYRLRAGAFVETRRMVLLK